MTKYNVSPLVAREIEFSTGTIFGGSWCRYFISITLHQCYIEATWKTRPKNDLDGNKFLEENQWKIYPLLANIMQVFLPTGNYQIMYTLYPQGFISVIAKPHDK